MLPQTAFADCYQLMLDGRKSLFYFAEHEIDKGDPMTEYAVVWIHGLGGGNSDGAKELRKKLAALPVNGKIYCIAPSFNESKHLRNPAMPGKTLLWDKDNWRGGGRASNGCGISSFTLVDLLCGKLADREKYPRLRHILIAGFSAGGQFVNRYVAVGNPPQKEGVKYAFAVGGPSSCLYIDIRRFQDGCFSIPANPPKQFDHWRNGLEKRNHYARKLSQKQVFDNLASRFTLYMCGSNDTGEKQLDKSEGSMLQGKTRYDRFETYRKYIALFPQWQKMTRFVVVPNAGHDKKLVMFEHPEFMALVMGNPVRDGME